MSISSLPVEVAEFERLLQKPAADPTGLAGFFGTGEIWVSRAPARLDVIGGIADYSGANVCEGVLGRGMLIALQPRTDATLRIRTAQVGPRALPVETRIPLSYFRSAGAPAGTAEGAFADYADIRSLCHANPVANWAAYIGGSIFSLLKEQGAALPFGFSMLLLSAVPMNVGIGSSAAVEVGTLMCLSAYLGLKLDSGRIARLGQIAEHQVVGAPCGIMDQIACTAGREGKLLHILCRPGSVIGEVQIPPGTGFVGINSMVRHSVGAAPYGFVRAGAFMGKKIINTLRKKSGRPAIAHLAELTPEEFRRDALPQLPEKMKGADFLCAYGSHDDPATVIQPDAVYRIAGPTQHPVEENQRVLTFMQALSDAGGGDSAALARAGEMMYAAHESYRENCHLSAEAVDDLVAMVRKRGAAAGLYGAKITGGGTGGTVAVFGSLTALQKEIPEIAAEYSRRIGEMPDVFEGTSPGAAEFGARRYAFNAAGWKGVPVTP